MEIRNEAEIKKFICSVSIKYLVFLDLKVSLIHLRELMRQGVFQESAWLILKNPPAADLFFTLWVISLTLERRHTDKQLEYTPDTPKADPMGWFYW